MIIETNKGQRIKIDIERKPQWSEMHQRFYAAGRRWIKSKQHFSATVLLHNFTSYTTVEE